MTETVNQVWTEVQTAISRMACNGSTGLKEESTGLKEESTGLKQGLKIQ